MSVPTESPVNWVKSTGMRIMEDIKQVVIAQDLYFAERWDMGTDCPEERYKVKVGDVEALCNTLHHLHTTYGPLMVVIEGRETNGDVSIGCYLGPNNKRAAIIRMQPKVKETASNSRVFASANPPFETEEIVIFETPMGETQPCPITSCSTHQISSSPPTEEVEEFAPLVAKNESCDFNPCEEDYESVELSGNTELDEEWVNIEYPAGSNGWWRGRQRAKGR